jgi:hypothetical protein
VIFWRTRNRFEGNGKCQLNERCDMRIDILLRRMYECEGRRNARTGCVYMGELSPDAP